MLPSTKTALSVLLGVGSATALNLPIHRRAPPHGTTVHILPTANVTGDDPFGFESVGGNAYCGTIFVAGEPFLVQLDTGSSDLWIDSNGRTLSGLTDTGIQGGVSYVDGSSALGNINLGNVTWGDFVVPQQAFINAPDATATNNGEFQGLLGIGPPNISDVEGALSKTQWDGSTFLDNVFSLYPSEPNFITFLLNRSAAGTIDGGIFTIGEVAPGYDAINNATQLDVVTNDFWMAFMDAVVINGQPMSGGSMGSPAVASVPSDKTLVVLDTGTSLSTAPQSYVDAIWGPVPGAVNNNDGSWTVPCDTKLNISMRFSGVDFPMNPIDITAPSQILTDGTVICVGFLSATDPSAGTDFLLGDSFLRNVYSLFDYGFWARVGDTAPFMKILSVTDPNQAWADFDAANAARIALIQQVYGGGAGGSGGSGSSSDTPSAAVASSTPTPDAGSASPAVAAAVVTSSPAFKGSDKDVSGAVADSTDGITIQDYNNLYRNSWIAIGLLCLIFAGLCVIAGRLFCGPRSAKPGKGYRTIADPSSVPPAHDKPYNPQYSDYSTPYADHQ